MFLHLWINQQLSEENKVPEHCLKLERWQKYPWSDLYFICFSSVFYLDFFCILSVFYLDFIGFNCFLCVFYQYFICILSVFYLHFISILSVFYQYFICILFVFYLDFICILSVFYLYFICILSVFYLSFSLFSWHLTLKLHIRWISPQRVTGESYLSSRNISSGRAVTSDVLEASRRLVSSSDAVRAETGQ